MSPIGSNISFYVSPPAPFSGFSRPFAESRYVVVGVPYDMTSSYRSGSRFGPAALREASLNVETYSLRSNIDLEDIPIADLGDIHVVANPSDMVERVKAVVKDIVESRKVPVLVGGEHLITLGAVQAFPSGIGLIDFDAHLDLRESYMGEHYSHATFMRKVVGMLPPENIVFVGTRAVSKEEINFSRGNGITIIDASELRELGSEQCVKRILMKLAGLRSIYVTVDMDVFDPAYAPAVGNPETGGLSPDMVLTLLNRICDNRTVGFDLVEISPHYDTGITAALGARIIFETICTIEKSESKVAIAKDR